MNRRVVSGVALILLGTACGPVISRAKIASTPQRAMDCAAGLLASRGYQVVDVDDVIRAERPKHAAFGHGRADYDRVSVAIVGDELRVRGETVSMSGGLPMASMRGSVPASGGAGGTSPTVPSKEVRADVKRMAIECGTDS